MRLQLKKRVSALSRWLDGEPTNRPKRIREPVLLLDTLADDPVKDDPGSAVVTPNRLMLARVFDSAHPVRNRDELLGRQRELDALLSATLDFGQHAIVHGARGSGKTSLVRIVGDHADQNGAVVIYMACEPGASFADLILPYLRALPPAALRSGERDVFAREVAKLPATVGPRAVVELVAGHVAVPVIFIFDEFDRITDAAVKGDIAAAMKLLSDALATVMFMLVGIARDVSDVVEAHPSLRRHMRAVALGRIASDSVEQLVTNGAAAAGLVFDADARQIIARAACGSPFHVRIFAHHAALAAMQQGGRVVDEVHARAGLRTALQQWAALNIDDTKTFVRLVESGQKLDILERSARRAAINDRLEQDETLDATGTAMLADAIQAEAGKHDTLVFRDSVAPQFLIAFIILAEVPSTAEGLRVARQEPFDAVA